MVITAVITNCPEGNKNEIMTIHLIIVETAHNHMSAISWQLGENSGCQLSLLVALEEMSGEHKQSIKFCSLRTLNFTAIISVGIEIIKSGPKD